MSRYWTHDLCDTDEPHNVFVQLDSFLARASRLRLNAPKRLAFRINGYRISRIYI